MEMKQVIADFLKKEFDCENENIIKELAFVLSPIVEKSFHEGYAKGYEEGSASQRHT